MTMDILRTSSLAKVRDGAVAAKLDAELVRLFSDCEDRPLMKKPRKVTLEITITPDGQTADLSEVSVSFNIKSSIPATEIVRPMKAMRKRNGFGFDEDTDSVDHSPAQRRLSGIDSDDGDDE